MTTLRVILDDMIDPVAGWTGRYSEELTRALLATAPRGADVGAFVSSSPESDYARIADRLPGLRGLQKSALARRELSAAWHRGFTRLPGSGMTHATGLLAPLYRHDRFANPGEQIVVTMHDAIAWTNPELLPSRRASWLRAMGKRAERHADAVVVSTHSAADAIAENLALGDRIRVISPASTLPEAPADAAERRARLNLPERYVLAVAEMDPANGLADLIAAAPTLPVPLVVVREGTVGPIDEAPNTRVLDAPPTEDYASVVAGAAVSVHPDRAAGFPASLLVALTHGIPVVHSDAPALIELAAESGLSVERHGPLGYGKRLSDAVSSALGDPDSASRLSVSGLDRSRAFTWRDAGEKVWQLHADL